MKICTRCGDVKPSTGVFFHRKPNGSLNARCRACDREYSRLWRLANLERARERDRRRRAANRKPRVYARIRTKEDKAAYVRKWHAANAERVREIKRASYERNKFKPVALEKREAKNALRRERRRANASDRLHNNVSRRIRASLCKGKNGASWETLVGYTTADLRAHLERQFARGMTWENYGTRWEVDHIVPLREFKIEEANDPHFLAAWALANLRPLKCRLNKKKSGRRAYLL